MDPSNLPFNVQRAREYAIKYHGDQKYGDLPYVSHLDDVAAILIEHGADEETLEAAYLHDIVEDVKEVTREIIANDFSNHISMLVWSVTGEGINRKEKLACVITKLLEYPQAVDLKLADRLANGRRSKESNAGKFQMYRKEHPRMFLALNHLGNPALWALLVDLFADSNPS